MNNSTTYPIPNSFALKVYSNHYLQPANINDLVQISQNLPEIYYILGEGSNSLFSTKQTAAIIKPNFKGINVTNVDNGYLIKVGASQNWHELVEYTVSNGFYGLENLALIPGSVGAAPVQNIGAYGVEFSDVCAAVYWFDWRTRKERRISKKDCEFSYRESVFKKQLKNQGVITAVEIFLPKKWLPKLTYSGLDGLPENISALCLMHEVIRIRQSKLPDIKTLPNAGSFFKNPIVDKNTFNQLITIYPEMPHYSQKDGKIKLAAGWLIDKCGLKGFKINDAKVHDKQALVLVNNNKATGNDLIRLARYIQQQVKNKFSIKLDVEVRIIGKYGETSLDLVNLNE